jgi:hypothetical protein
MKKVKNEAMRFFIKLCPKANKVSLLHLTIAVRTKHRYFCTSDKYILRKAKEIKKKFHIEVVSDPYVNTSGFGFNYYL